MIYSGICNNTKQAAVLYCEHATIEIPDFWHPESATITWHNEGKEDETLTLPFSEGGATGFQFEIEEAMKRLRNGELESPHMSWEESIRIMETIDLVRERIGLSFPFEGE